MSVLTPEKPNLILVDVETVEGNPFVVIYPLDLGLSPLRVTVQWDGGKEREFWMSDRDPVTSMRRPCWLLPPEGADRLAVLAVGADGSKQAHGVMSIAERVKDRRKAGVLERPAVLAKPMMDPTLQRALGELAQAIRLDAGNRRRDRLEEGRAAAAPEPPAVWKWPAWAQKLVKRA